MRKNKIDFLKIIMRYNKMTNENKGLILFGAGYNVSCISRKEFEDVKQFTFFDGLPNTCYYKQEHHGWKFTNNVNVFIQKILTNVEMFLKDGFTNAIEIDENHFHFELTRGRTLDYYINTTVEKALLLHKDLINNSQVLFMEGFDPFEKGLTLEDVENATFFATFRDGNFGKHKYTYIPEGVDGSKPRLAALKAERKALRISRYEKIMSNKELNIKKRTDKDGIDVLFIQFEKNGKNVKSEVRIVDYDDESWQWADTKADTTARPCPDLVDMCIVQLKCDRMYLYNKYFMTEEDKVLFDTLSAKFTAYRKSIAEDELALAMEDGISAMEDDSESESESVGESEDDEIRRYLYM